MTKIRLMNGTDLLVLISDAVRMMTNNHLTISLISLMLRLLHKFILQAQLPSHLQSPIFTFTVNCLHKSSQLSLI